MVPAKKSDSDPKPTAKVVSATRPGVPLSNPAQKADFKAAAAGDKQPTSVSITSEPAPSIGLQPADAGMPSEKLERKLRRKDEILTALRAGARLIHTTSGLYRVVAAEGTQNPTSKRRVLAFIQQGILKATENDSRIYLLDAEAEKAALEKKAATKSEKGTIPSGNSTATK